MRRVLLSILLFSSIILNQNMWGQTATLAGSIFSNNNESDVRSGGETILIILSGESWESNIGLNNDTTTALINSFQGNQDWSTITANISFTNVTRVSADTVSILLPQVLSYDIFSNESVNIEIDQRALVGSLSSITSGNSFTIIHDPVSAVISGTILSDPGNRESNIQTGGSQIIIDLTNDTWASDLGTADNSSTNQFIASFSGPYSWNLVSAALGFTNITRNSDTRVTIILPAVPAYNTFLNEIVSFNIRHEALTGSTNDVSTSETFTIIHDPVTASLSGTVVPSVTESEMRAGTETIILSLQNDIWQTGPGFNAVRQAIIEGISGGPGWNLLEPNIDPSNVIRTNDAVVTINIPVNNDYYIGVNETLTATIPGSALENQTYNVTASPNFTVINEGVSLTVSGSLTELPRKTETDIRNDNETIILTLDGDTWNSNVANVGAQAAIVLSNIRGSSSWNNIMNNLMDEANLSLSGDRKSLTITFFPTYPYDIDADDYIDVSVPNSVLHTTTTGTLIENNAFFIEALSASLSLSGNIYSGIYDDEDSIRAGGGTIVLVLSEDSWVPAMGTNSAVTEELINGIDGGTSWNSQVRSALLGGDRGAASVNVSGNILTITLPSVPAYSIISSDNITITVSDNAFLNSSDGNIVLSPDLVIQPAPRLAILTDPSQEEYQIDGTNLIINLKDETFKDNSIALSSVNTNYPGFVSISSVNWISGTQFSVSLIQSGDFDTNINLDITIAASELSQDLELTTNSFLIPANLEPEITSVSIPTGNYKIGDLVRVDISTVSNTGLYTLENGSVAGNQLDSINKFSNSLYYAYFTVEDGDTDYQTADSIPYTNIRLDNSPLTGETASGKFKNDVLIDAHKPLIYFMEVSGESKKIGDLIDILVSTDGTGYDAVNPTNVNVTGIGGLEWHSLGNGIYRLKYIVQENDQSVTAGNLQVELTLRDDAGNLSNTATSLNVNQVEIDAVRPAIRTVSVLNNKTATIGDTIKILIETDADPAVLSFDPNETRVNNLPYLYSDITGYKISDSFYGINYIVRSGHQQVDSGDIAISLRLIDPAGNESSVYNTVETNNLAIYTDLPSANMVGSKEICIDDSANLLVSLSGRKPFDIYISDGTTSTLYISDDYSFEFNVSPDITTTYKVDSVIDVSRIKNTGIGQTIVNVNLKTDVSIEGLDPSYSVEDTLVELVANVSGGIFSGPGVFSNSFFNPKVAGTVSSPHSIIYTYSNAKGCVSSDTVVVSVLSANSVISLEKEVYCYNENEFLVTATNNRGVTGYFTLFYENERDSLVEGLTDLQDNSARINPLLLKPGEYKIQYTYFDNKIKLSKREDFVIETIDAPEILVAPDSICENDSPEEIKISPSSAYFIHSPAIGLDEEFYFYPGQAVTGLNMITVEDSTINGCKKTDSKEVFVIYVPEIMIGIVDSCIIGDNMDTTLFLNETADKNIFESWTWNFGDAGSGSNISNEIEGRHSYRDPGPRTISLYGETPEGCSDNGTFQVNFGEKPFGGFIWTNECWIEGDSILFVSEADSRDDFENYTWKFFHSESDSIVKAGSDNVYHIFPGIETYHVSLYVRTTIGCENNFVDSIQLKNTFRLVDEGGFYEQDFEVSDGRWSSESGTGSQYNSWDYGMSDFQSLAEGKNSKSWFLNPPDSSGITEQSYILSPCFDIRGIEKPMVSVDIFKDMLDNEGVTLQYTLNNGNTWKNLGTVDQGINWFNSYEISGSPGGQGVGWTSRQVPDIWMGAKRYASDEIENVPNVQFRFIYGADHSKGLNHEGFGFDNFKIQSRERVVLIEHFTNGNNPVVKETDGLVNFLYNRNFSDVVKLEYHTDINGSDVFFDQNKYVPGTRMLYYGVNEVPTTMVYSEEDSQMNIFTRSTVDNLDDEFVSRESLFEPLFDIDLTTNYNSDNIDINVEISSREDLSAEERIVQVVVFEKLITGVIMENGQVAFLNVVKDMIPNAAGTAYFDEWTKAQPVQLQYNWSHSNVYDPSMLRVAVFVQNDLTRQVYQVVTDDDTNLSTGNRSFEIKPLKLIAYPNPAKNEVFISQNKLLLQDYIIHVYNQTGKLVQEENWYSHETLKRIDISNLSGGFYILHVKDKKGSHAGVVKLSVYK